MALIPGRPAARQIGHGAMWSLVNSSLGQLLVLLVFFVTARFVSAADFGVMAICLLVVELVKQVLVESFAAAITASADPDDRDYNACFLLILACSVGGAALALGIGVFGAPLFDNPQLAPVLQLVSLLLVTSGLSRTHEAWMARHMQFRALAIRSIVSIVIGGAVGIYLAVNGWGVFALVAQQLVIAVIATASLWKLCAWRPGLDTKPGAYRALWRYGRHTALAGFTNFANTQADTVFASWYLGAAATGIYTSAKRILLGVNLSLVTALNRVALPAFANLRSDPDRMRASFLTAAGFTSAITAPIFAGLAVVSSDVVLIAMGPSWTAVGPILSLIAVTAYLTTIGQYNQAVILVHDKPQWQVVMTAIHAASNIALFAVVIQYGLTALAAAFSIRAILLYPMSIGAALVLLRLKLWAYVRRVAPSVASALAMAGAVFLFRVLVPIDHVAPRLAASVAVGIVAYCLAMAVAGRGELLSLLRFGKVMVRAAEQ